MRVTLVLLLALLTYLVQRRPVRALAYLVVGLVAVAVEAALRRRRPPAAEPTTPQRARRAALAVIAIGESLAVALGVVQPRDIWRLAVGAELAAAVVALTALPAMLRAVRRQRAGGASWVAALLAAAEELLPPGLLAVARVELGIYRGAFRLAAPRPRAERGALRLSYGASQRLLLYALLMVGLVELTVTDYLVRNTFLRVPLLLLGLLTFPYLLGLVGRTKAYPHLLYDDRLLVRSGPDFALEVPLVRIARASRRTRISQRNGAHLEHDGALRLASGGQTDLLLHLTEPLPTQLGHARCLEIALDHPRHPAVDRLADRG